MFHPRAFREYADDHSCPYLVGKKINLQLNEAHEGQLTTATIVKVFEPFTLPAQWSSDLIAPLSHR